MASPASRPPVVIGRFAPSPTGRMHAGNVFSALVCWILVRREGGRMVLRIEDLDASRSRPDYAQDIVHDLDFLGLSWDDGPFFQQGREGAYEQAFQTLCNAASTYPCFCTRADIHAAAAPHTTDALRYPGTCRALTNEERSVRRMECAAQGRNPSVRLAVDDTTVTFVDHLQYEQGFNLSRDCGDFIVQRSDGGYSYQLAVVVDDHAQGVNFVVRGCDLLPSTAAQLYLFGLLGYGRPRYAHIPLFVADDGRRIAKRDNDAGLDVLLATYKTADRILGHIAFVAGMVDEDGAYSAEELLRYANIERLEGRRSILWHG